MRLTIAFASLAALAFASAASAQTATISPISFSPEFQEELTDNYGEREGEYLGEYAQRMVSEALARRGASAGVTVDISIIDAQPNRPTFEQLSNRPGLDPIRSISVGGAELHGVIRGADGAVITEVSHERYNHSLSDLTGAESTWSEARRAIRQFANKVGDAYVASAR
ncbi:DUF3313 family protein [Vitreimonas flagellata]|uniref:DUF3313 family protein n=1 Tax=Vitreimonas flagellata TaxID=2560861 RepID=UPI001074DCB8|nr:DUF3313 family protein [Vitreimonas flagellata]